MDAILQIIVKALFIVLLALTSRAESKHTPGPTVAKKTTVAKHVTAPPPARRPVQPKR